MELKKVEDHSSLNTEDKINVAWFRQLDELDREIVLLFVAAFQKSQQSLESFNVQAVLYSFQERQLLAA